MDKIFEDEKCILETKDGPICGYIDIVDGNKYYKFKSIPYATPPLGRLRFLPPSPIGKWTHLKDCTVDAPLPMSFHMFETITGSEDCLYIEVSTPAVQPDKPLPVMFWIGCYCFVATIDPICDPTLINAQNVVFVRCGFRLGPLGFLSINDFSAAGNCGLKDIVMALGWVQRNISVFGGDPNNVTLFGTSSGGAIVHFMMLSPMATGLFHKAVIQSASALNGWSLAKNPSKAVLELATALGINKKVQIEIVEELRLVSAMDIMEGFKTLWTESEDLESDLIDSKFKPCVEIEFEGQTSFITKSPVVILKSGNFNKVPLLIGSNNTEGELFQFIKKDFYNDFKKYNENANLLVPKSLQGDTQLTNKIGQQLLKFYLGGDDQLAEDTKTQYLQIIGDFYYLYYVNKTVRLHKQFAPESPVYYYVMNYAGEWRVPQNLNFFNSLGHSAEIPLIFRIKLPEGGIAKGSRDSEKTRSRVVKMWTNFAKYGNPTPDENDSLLQITWDPVENMNKLNYLNIGSELTKGRNPFEERMSFWDNLHTEHLFHRALFYFNDSGVSMYS